MYIQVYTHDCLKRNDEKIDNYIYYKKTTESSNLYFPWPTDLLPHEIDNNIANLDKVKKNNNCVFIGSINKLNNLSIKEFCINNNINFIKLGGFDKNNIDTEENYKYISESLIAPAIQSKWQVDNGYIPCRIFKNISYGKIGITNSETVYNLFNRNIIYNNDIHNCLHLGLEFENNSSYSKIMIPLMKYVRDNHTYINRINIIMKYLNI